jgi:hypothetical protein
VSGKYLVVACPRCDRRRVVEAGRKSTTCPGCGRSIDLTHARALVESPSVEDAQTFLGAAAAKAAGESLPRGPLKGEAGPGAEHERVLRSIAASVGGASGRTNQLKLILRRGFEAFGELTDADLARICTLGEVPWSGPELAEAALEQGLCARSKNGALLPLREGS